MEYSEEFKTEVKRCYPFNKELHALVDSSSYNVGRYLSDAADGNRLIRMILDTESDTLQMEAIKEARDRRTIYSLWLQELKQKTR